VLSSGPGGPQVGPEVGPTSALYSGVLTRMHGPTCIFWRNLTPFSLQYGFEVCFGGCEDGLAGIDAGGRVILLHMAFAVDSYSDSPYQPNPGIFAYGHEFESLC
jgi:hypothetical protein